jgi:UDP-N-acetylglucosamine transferase subunit ALG13
VILVTLGTHPQPMTRLVPELARLARELPELGPFHAQLGSTAVPDGWTHDRVMPASELAERIAAADVVITHGGPATIAEARAAGRVPIVVPRRHADAEHVDDHQLHYARRLAGAREVLLVEDVTELVDTVRRYQDLAGALPAATAHDPASAIAAIGLIGDRLLGIHR